jgi:hypothetical protein
MDQLPNASSPPEQQPQPDEEAMCRYCFDGADAGPLISPCRLPLIYQQVLCYIAHIAAQLHRRATLGSPHLLAALAEDGAQQPRDTLHVHDVIMLHLRDEIVAQQQLSSHTNKV